jgi:hypothetical protein
MKKLISSNMISAYTVKLIKQQFVLQNLHEVKNEK